MTDWRTSAAYRIAFTYSAAFAVLIAVLGIAVYLAADRSFRQQQDDTIAEESAALIHEYRSEGLVDLLERIGERETRSATKPLGYVLFDASGRRIAGGLDTRPTTTGWHNIVFEDPEEGRDPARALATSLPDGLLLMVAADTEALERIDHAILVLFGGAFVLVLIIGAGGALMLGSYLRERLERISNAARTIMAGELTQRMPVGPRGDEFDTLAASLNAMLDRISQLLDNLRQVSSDLAHDLRTPLVRMRGELERALDPHVAPDAHKAAVEQALVRSDDVLALFAAILRISEIEGGELARTFAPVELATLVADVSETCEPAIIDGGRHLRCTIDSAVTVNVLADAELIAQALINLIDNAQAYTPNNTVVTISLEQDAGTAQIIVADNGPGVGPADHQQMMRRFVRLDASRTTPGHGLGLNLVAAIAVMHGGALSFADNMPGLRAIISLPITKN